MNRKTIIPLLGAPCSGKSTAGKASGFQYFSSGDLLRERAADTDNMADHIRKLNRLGLYLEDDAMMELFSQKLRCYDSEILLSDGVPRTLLQVRSLDVLAERKEYSIPFAISFDCPRDILERRYSLRASQGSRADDALPYDRRFSQFSRFTLPVVDFYEEQGRLRTIDASQNAVEVLSQLEEVLKDLDTF